jgi:hypothetical protein
MMQFKYNISLRGFKDMDTNFMNLVSVDDLQFTIA